MGEQSQRFALLLAVAAFLLGTLYTSGFRWVVTQDWQVAVSPLPHDNMTGNVDSNINKVERRRLTMMARETMITSTKQEKGQEEEEEGSELARLSDLDRLEEKILEDIFSEGGRMEHFVKGRPDLFRPWTNLSEEGRKGRKKVVKVLVQTMARSGSSFLGEMLSLPQPSKYFFEPLRKIRWTDSALEHWREVDLNRIVPKMSEIFSCDLKSIEDGKNKNTAISECSNANLIVAKTIRLRRDKFEEWKRKEGSLDWLKVVHLVRDPRARYSSLLHSPQSSFKNVINIFTNSCKWELDDLGIRDLIPKEKSSNYDPDTWKKELPLDSIRGIEFTCAEAMERLGYHRFKPPPHNDTVIVHQKDSKEASAAGRRPVAVSRSRQMTVPATRRGVGEV